MTEGSTARCIVCDEPTDDWLACEKCRGVEVQLTPEFEEYAARVVDEADNSEFERALFLRKLSPRDQLFVNLIRSGVATSLRNALGVYWKIRERLN
jgi:hypothetical protein